MPSLKNELRDGFIFGYVDITGIEVIKSGRGDIAYITISSPTDFKGMTPFNIKDIVLADTQGRVMKLDIDTRVGPAIPGYFNLKQNYPNPFNPNTRIDYALPKPCQVKFLIYNILGQTVNVLVNEYQEAGEYSIVWDSKDSDGREVATGVYFYHIEAGDFVKSKKMLLLK